MKPIGITMKKNLPMACLIGSITGTLITAFLSAKAGSDASKDLIDKKKDPDSIKNHIRYEWKKYLIPGLSCVVTTVLILQTDTMNKQKQAALASTCALIEKSYKELKNKVEELHPGAIKEVQESLVKDASKEETLYSDDEELLFYDMYSKRFFNKPMEEVKDAEYELNRNFVLKGFSTANDFYNLLDIEEIKGGDDVGWSCYGEETYGYKWIDFVHEKTVLNDGLECYIISMPFEPHSDFLDM